MSQKATVNPIKVPYTPVKCPVCHADYKEYNPRKEVEEGNPYSKCPEGHMNIMEMSRSDNTLVVALKPIDDTSSERKTNRSQVS